MAGVRAAALSGEPGRVDGIAAGEVADPAKVTLLCVFRSEPDVVHDEVEVAVAALGDDRAAVAVW